MARHCFHRFFPQAGADLAQSYNDEDGYPPVSSEILRLSSAFPFGIDDNAEKTLDFLFENLPPEPRAWSLCETYMEQATWAFSPIRREELIDEILSPIYKVIKEKNASGFYPPHSISAHKLAAMFFVFTLGALVDLTLEPCQSLSIASIRHI